MVVMVVVVIVAVIVLIVLVVVPVVSLFSLDYPHRNYGVDHSIIESSSVQHGLRISS
jgi:hypothetical protein